jgi:hypothetical protein
MLGAGATMSVALTAFRYTKGLRGYDIAEDDEEEVERRENMKKYRRRPISETIEQLGEGRGKHIWIYAEHMADFIRNLRSRLRREEAPANHGQIRHRRQGRTRGKLDAIHHFLIVQERWSNSSFRHRTPAISGSCTYII